MEETFLKALEAARKEAATLGVAIRPVTDMQGAYRVLSGHRESDGFFKLADLGRLDLSLEAVAVRRPFTELFDDAQANTALSRLLDCGYTFSKT